MIVRRHFPQRAEWFRNMRFGMFIHFGLYSILGRHEWAMYREKIARPDYEKLMARFNPRRFDADQWVATARRCGCRYITVTAKHHDGFCLFDSALTDYKITNTPFGRDLIGELVRACHKAGMRICLYYSQPDWHHPAFVNRPGAFKDWPERRPEDRPDWGEYLRYCHGQVRELVTRYGRIDGIWFDGSHKTEREWRGRELYRLIKRHQPQAVVNDRAGYGDYFTPERRLAGEAAADGYMVESCQAVDTWSWGYSPGSALFTTPVLIRSLVRMAAVGGNFLLNVGPKPDGTLPAAQVRRFEDIGAWLRRHGEAVFGTQGCPRRPESEQMLYTRRDRVLYLHLLEWPDRDQLDLKQLDRLPTDARLLGGGRLTVSSGPSGPLLCGFPTLPPDPSVNVVRLRFSSADMFRPPPKGPPAPVFRLRPGAKLKLPADRAATRGYWTKGTPLRAVPIGRRGEKALDWQSPDQTASWTVRTDRAMRCEVAVELACPAPYAGSTFVLEAGRKRLPGIVPATPDSGVFRRVRIGRLRLAPGKTTLTLRPVKLNYGYIFGAVRGIRLSPC